MTTNNSKVDNKVDGKEVSKEEARKAHAAAMAKAQEAFASRLVELGITRTQVHGSTTQARKVVSMVGRRNIETLDAEIVTPILVGVANTAIRALEAINGGHISLKEYHGDATDSMAVLQHILSRADGDI